MKSTLMVARSGVKRGFLATEARAKVLALCRGRQQLLRRSEAAGLLGRGSTEEAPATPY
eukprot:CAMPEP_0177777092 /NCGR_PEP_ID=MMETSP0491_2-20121128/15103_1 /TAXON_ID=63592 /ORGANISM="Tetraselmis chuii, Strain PLY429" /LENGTH=58 /DNA_ID=CAMNT_0019296009 /DNA_START=244 /DNA_END=420 /DNA_ORIENTATION=-